MKVLFIGNSHTYFNEMPHMVTVIAQECGVNVEPTMLTQGGMSLLWHSMQDQTLFNIRYGGYEKVVLQNVAHPFDGIDALREGVGALLGEIIRAGIHPCLYETWASLAEPQVQQDMNDAYRTVANEIGADIAPVGEVWQIIREAGDVNLFYEDGEHASVYGSYLAACVIFCTLCGWKSLLPDAKGDFYIRTDLDFEICNKIHEYVFRVLSSQTSV